MQEHCFSLLICANDECVGREAAERFACAAISSVSRHGRFTVAIPGGSSPRGMFEHLTQSVYSELVPWDRTWLFFTDERCVPPDSDESNYRLAHEMLISKVPLPPGQVYRFEGERDPAEAAARYGRQLRQSLGPLPRFHLIVLGMGPDGHTASLFPHSPALQETERLASENYVEKLQAHRLTLTLPVLNGAEQVLALAMGRDKAATLRDVLQGEHRPSDLPVQAVRPMSGRMLWLVSPEAASELRQ